MPPDLVELKRILEKQNVLLSENNQMLQKVRRYQVTTFWMTMLWYALLVGLPFALFYYVIGPYVQALGFTANMEGIPGYHQFEYFFGLKEGE